MLHSNRALTLLAAILIYLFWMPALLFAAVPPRQNQIQEEDNFVYIVQPGDTLALIAGRYNLTVTDIIRANNLTTPNVIYPGQRLILPHVSVSNPPVSVALPPDSGITHIVQAGETLFSIASHYGVSIGAIVLANKLANPDIIQVGQTLQISGGPQSALASLPPPFVAVDLSEPVIIQGRTLVVKVTLSDPATLSGTFEGSPLFFSGGYELSPGRNLFWSIVPIYALAEPGIYPLVLTANSPDGSEVTTLSNVTVVEGPYGQETIQLDDKRGELLDPELTRLEKEKLTKLWSQVSPRPYWEGPFRYPLKVNSLRITSYFGTRRSYNGSTVTGFHEGLDLGGGIGLPIYASAAGRIVLAERLAVRGNAVLIDHGLGLFTGYWHQSQLAVSEGQEVKAGDLIGYIGDTGLVTGPHLHWEMRLNGVAVDPRQWVRQVIP